jgi:hypothetical protein
VFIFGIFTAVVFFTRIRTYKKTAYFAETGRSFWATWFYVGTLGEYLTVNCLEHIRGYKRFLINVYIPKKFGGTTELDIIMLHSSGIYVFESKNYSGQIYGAEREEQWTQRLKHGYMNKFFNPCLQNAAHIKNLKNFCPDINPDAFVSVIVFSERCELKKVSIETGRHIVTKRENLISAINANTTRQILSDDNIDNLYRKLKKQTQVDNTVKIEHIKHVTDMKEHKTCPYCGRRLILRTAKKSGNKFWGCSGYPQCRYTAKYEPDL